MKGAGVRGGLAAVAALAMGVAATGFSGEAPAATTAAGKFRYVQRTFSVPATSRSRLQIARCPRGTHVYGGGTTNQHSFGRGAIVASMPVDLGDSGRVPDDGWGVRYDNFAAGPVNAVVTAVCGRAAPRYRSASAQVGAGRYEGHRLRCPRATYAWGGGAINRAPYQSSTLSETYPDGTRAWASTLANLSGAPHRVTVFAICGTRQPRYVRDSTTLIPQASGLWDADCPNQRFHLISGGASNSSPGTVLLNTLNPADADRADAAPDDEMTASFHNYSNAQQRATVHAVCLR